MDKNLEYALFDIYGQTVMGFNALCVHNYDTAGLLSHVKNVFAGYNLYVVFGKQGIYEYHVSYMNNPIKTINESLAFIITRNDDAYELDDDGKVIGGVTWINENYLTIKGFPFTDLFSHSWMANDIIRDIFDKSVSSIRTSDSLYPCLLNAMNTKAIPADSCDEAIMCAVIHDPSQLENVENPSIEMINYVIGVSWKNMKYIRRLGDRYGVCRRIIKINPWAVFSLPIYREEFIIEALSLDGLIISMIEDPTPHMCSIAIHQNPKAYFHIKDKSKCSRLEEKLIIADDWRNIKNIENPSKYLCMGAIDQNPEAIRLMKNPSEMLWSYALGKDGMLLKWAKHLSLAPIYEALNQNPLSIKYVLKPTEEMKEFAVTRNGLALKFIKKQSYKICLMAAKNNIKALAYLNDTSMLVSIMDDILSEK